MNGCRDSVVCRRAAPHSDGTANGRATEQTGKRGAPCNVPVTRRSVGIRTARCFCYAPRTSGRNEWISLQKNVSRNMRWAWRLIRDETARLLLENSRLTQIRSRVGPLAGAVATRLSRPVRCHGHATTRAEPSASCWRDRYARSVRLVRGRRRPCTSPVYRRVVVPSTACHAIRPSLTSVLRLVWVQRDLAFHGAFAKLQRRPIARRHVRRPAIEPS